MSRAASPCTGCVPIPTPKNPGTSLLPTRPGPGLCSEGPGLILGAGEQKGVLNAAPWPLWTEERGICSRKGSRRRCREYIQMVRDTAPFPRAPPQR